MRGRILAFVLAASLLLSLAACGGGAKATTMHLMKTAGTVGVSDDGGKEIKPKENLGLYSGYGVDTQSDSYAWIDLDEVKLTKMDQNSDISIQKEDKHLEIVVNSGSLFFNVTEPLAEDETMEIRTSSMVVGIRGTCGWVTENTAALLEGTVEVAAGEQSVTITAGEMAYLTESGELMVKPFYQEGIPAFVAEEPLDGDILNEVPPLYPLTVLTKQAIYDYRNGETIIQNYFYDEAGYILRQERSYDNSFVSGQASVATYSYDGYDSYTSERHCVTTDFMGNTHETTRAPGDAGTVEFYLNGCFSDPLLKSNLDVRSEIGPDGRLELGSNIGIENNVNLPAGSYAIYTMDANGCPINIDTYAPDGTLTGQCTLEWAVIQRPQ